jgi:hypothetical protein
MVNPRAGLRQCSRPAQRQRTDSANFGVRPERTRSKQSVRKTMENIFPNVGVFFAACGATVNGPRLPRNPPQTHHKNTTAAHHIFQNHPQKHQQTRGFSPHRRVHIFFWN